MALSRMRQTHREWFDSFLPHNLVPYGRKAVRISRNFLKVLYTKENGELRKPMIVLTSISLASGLVVLYYNFNQDRKFRIKLKKFYYLGHYRVIKFLNNMIIVNLPLSINVLYLFYYIQKYKNKDYNNVLFQFRFGLTNYLLKSFLSIGWAKFLQRYDILTKFDSKVLSYIEPDSHKHSIKMINLVNEVLDAELLHIYDLRNIIWEYLGSPNESVNDFEFNCILEYVNNQGTKLVINRHQRRLDINSGIISYFMENLEDNRRLFTIGRANRMLDKWLSIIPVPMLLRKLIYFSIFPSVYWIILCKKIMDKYSFQIISFEILYFICKRNEYLVRINFGIELKDKHSTMFNKYLYCVMGQEPLYLLLSLPVLFFKAMNYLMSYLTRFKHVIIDELTYVVDKIVNDDIED